MEKEQKICCRVTHRQIMGAIVLAATVVNLITVGAVVNATVPLPAPTSMETMLIPVSGVQVFTEVTATDTWTPTITFTPTNTTTSTPTSTLTLTPSPTSTETATPTFTSTSIPTLAFCKPMIGWPVYVVQPGDWLLAIARATGSSENQLQLANCLVGSTIYPGQKLYVPRLPITPTIVTSTPTDTPTDIKLAGVMECKPPVDVFLSVNAYDSQGVQSLIVRFYTANGDGIGQFAMQPDGNTFYGSGGIPQQYTVYDISYYYFIATDTYKNVTVSQPYKDHASSCEPPIQLK